MNIRLRKDLDITQRVNGLEAVWVLKDPVSFSHFQFSEQEFALAQMLEKGQSVEQVVSLWRERFKSISLSSQQVQNFIQRLISDNLVVVEKVGYGRLLGGRKNALESQQKTNWLRNPLAIRFRGWNPNSLLREFDWLGRIFFHPLMIVFNLVLAVAVLIFMLASFETVALQLPRIDELLATRGIVGLILTLVVVKVLHELGHAMACRQFGAECLEIGVMLLAFIPTLYCNVSDAWSINERWKRMMVSFAGMYVEICLAAIAALAWFFSPPGTLISALLFNVVVLCSISTVLVNGNPLLRYDGYYLLSDWLEKPNLNQMANKELSRFWAGLIAQPTDRVDADRKERSVFNGLLFYAGLSFLYRWFVVGLILYAVFAFAQNWRATNVGAIFVACLFVLMVVGRAKGFLAQIANQTVSKLRVALLLLVSVALVWFVFFIPLPKSVYGDLEVRLKNATPVYSPLNGRLVYIAESYQQVSAGDTVARIQSDELTNKVALKELELERAKNELSLLNSRINEDDSIAAKIEVAMKNVSAVSASWELMKTELGRGEVVATIDGTVFPTGFELVQQNPKRKSSSAPLNDPENENCFVRTSEPLLTLGVPTSKELVVLVSESDMDFVAVGQPVHIKFDRISTERFSGSVSQIFKTELDDTLNENSLNRSGKSFRVIVGLEEIPDEAVVGSIGRGKIAVPSESLGSRLMRVLTRDFNNRI